MKQPRHRQTTRQAHPRVSDRRVPDPRHFSVFILIAGCGLCFAATACLTGRPFGRPADSPPPFECALPAAPAAPEQFEPQSTGESDFDTATDDSDPARTAALESADYAAVIPAAMQAEDSAAVRRLKRAVAKSVRVQAYRGHFTRFAAAVIVGDRIVYRHLFQTPASRPFYVGSISKTFAALAVMRLAEAGLIELDDPIRKYLPDLQIADPRLSSAPVEIQDLLAHTSGLPDIRYYSPRAYRRAYDIRFPEQIYPAGLTYRYSNHGFMFLGRLVEKVSGLDYGTFVRRHIYRPLCMRHAKTHRQINGASGVGVSIEDLAAYASFWLRRGRGPTGREILSPATFDRMLRPRSLIAHGERKHFAGLGWRVKRDRDRVATFFHIGGAPGVAGWVQMFPEHNAAIAYLSNPPEYNGEFEWFLTKTQWRLADLAGELTGAKRSPHRFNADPPTQDLLRAYAGNYRGLLTREKVKVTHRNGSLYVKRGWERTFKMYNFTAHVFKGGEDYTHYDFVHLKKGQPHPTALATPAGYFVRVAPAAPGLDREARSKDEPNKGAAEASESSE